MYAVRNGDQETAFFLISKGANVNLLTKGSNTLLTN